MGDAMRTVGALSLDPNSISTRNARWKQETLATRFWRHVDKSSDCWLWTARLNFRGYGSFGIGNKRTAPAHRVAWVITYGPLKPGDLVLHKTHCTSKACVRPDHLYVGDQKQNMRDARSLGILKGRNVARGERAGHARLTEAAVEEMIVRYRRGETQASLRRVFGVCSSHMSRIVNGREWTHVFARVVAKEAP